MATNLSNWSNFTSGKMSSKEPTMDITQSVRLSKAEIWEKAVAANKAEPLDIEWVATSLFGLQIKRMDLGDEASGFLNELGDRWCIFINKYENIRRQRFTIAHELAHYILHKNNKKLVKDLIFFRDENNNDEEKEANEFAAELLMPEERVRDYIKNGCNTIKLLADKFNLSTPAVRYRAYKLNLIPEY